MTDYASAIASQPTTPIADEALGCRVPDIELQVLAFARWAHDDPPKDWMERSAAAAQTRPVAQHGVRLDVLSVAEALAASPPPRGRVRSRSESP